jgi:hypothetical protein
MTAEDRSEGPISGRAGYRNPPHPTRLRKGQSGNPRGRPKGRNREVPYETVLGQMVTVCESGTERCTTAAEAFLLQLVKRGLEGDGAAARAAMHAIAEVRDKRIVGEPATMIFSWQCVQGSVNTALETLRMAKMLIPFGIVLGPCSNHGLSTQLSRALATDASPLTNNRSS